VTPRASDPAEVVLGVQESDVHAGVDEGVAERHERVDVPL
jgi:hypothetical protein